MEPIERAVAKAREEQGDTEANTQPRNTALYAGGTAATPTPNEAGRSFEDIQYTRTQILLPDPNLLRERRLVTYDTDNANADLFRILRTKVLQDMRKQNLKTLAIVGATPAVGKSMVAANLAVAMSKESNQTVLLVDLDLRKPNTAWYFGFEPKLGIGDYLKKKVPIEDILVNPGFERLVILPGNKRLSHSSELLSSAKMSQLVDELRKRYESRIVIFDMPPLLASDDALSMMPHFDAALLVLEDGKTTAEEIRESRRLLQGTHLIGAVLNKGEQTVKPYYD